jgi:hypothetical protein
MEGPNECGNMVDAIDALARFHNVIQLADISLDPFDSWIIGAERRPVYAIVRVGCSFFVKASIRRMNGHGSYHASDLVNLYESTQDMQSLLLDLHSCDPITQMSFF